MLVAYPDMQTYHRNGVPATPSEGNPLSIDHPQFLLQFEQDLKQLWEYYGEHPSWIGWGILQGDQAHIAPIDGTVSQVGYSNSSIANFADTIYFSRDINETGFHTDKTQCKIWQAFPQYEPLKLFGWGTWQDSDELDVYNGTGESGRLVAMKFESSDDTAGFTIRWYGRRVGNPSSPIVIELYEDDGDEPKDLGFPIESASQLPDDIGIYSGWQPPIGFNSALNKTKNYWVVFQTLGGDSQNKYEVFRRNHKTDESTARYSEDGYFPNRWGFRGSAILWIKTMSGEDREIYPGQWIEIGLNLGSDAFQLFIPPENMTINTVFLHIADRMYDDTESIIRVERSIDGKILASGKLSQKLISGLWRWVSINLDNRIRLFKGEQYTIRLLKTEGEPWQWHRMRTNPPSGGFQGESKTFLFRLADMNLTSETNFVRCNYPTGSGLETSQPGVTDTHWAAVRFRPAIEASLEIIDVKLWQKYGNPAALKISLREDHDGNGSKPKNSDLESKTVFPEQMQAGTWISTTGWGTLLLANKWYWIVFSMASPASNSGYRVFQTVNPTDYKLLWTSNGGVSWDKGREVAELIFKAATTAEVFKVEPENAQFAAGNTGITDKDLMAQSFSVAADTFIKGILVYTVRPDSDPGEDLIADLRRDSGTNTPSTETLVSGTLPFTSNTGHGIKYIDFEFPLLLSPNEKYWIVLKSNANARLSVPYYMYREVNDSYGGAEHKTKRSSDGGLSWHLPEGEDVDIIFAIVQPAVFTDYPNTLFGTVELAEDISNYHTHPVADEPLHGWNAYLNLQTSEILKEAAIWFQGYTGRPWIYIDPNDIRLIEEAGASQNAVSLAFAATGPKAFPPTETYLLGDTLEKIAQTLKSRDIITYPWSSWGHLGNPLGLITPEQIELYYSVALPVLAREASFFDWDPQALSNANQQRGSLAFGEILSRMRYYGDYYGCETKEVEALFIGDRDIGMALQFLTPAIDITLHGTHRTGGDLNLTQFEDFRQFDVIVWWSAEPSMAEVTENVQERIKAFTNAGGGLVVTKSWPDWANPILGFDFTQDNTTRGTVDYINYSHPILKPYTNIQGYSYNLRDSKIIPYDEAGKHIVKDTNDTPWISEHTFGLGRGIFVGMPFEEWFQAGGGLYGSPRESYLVLLNNAIFYAAKKENKLPVWWFSEYRTQYLPWHEHFWFSINGRPGKPILVWLTNNGDTTEFEIHLNATFYHIDPSGWIALDVATWATIAKGSGTDIKLNVTVPEKAWMPIYICNQTTDTFSLYSNIFVLEQATSPIQIAYKLKGPYKQTSWLILNHSRPVTEITLDEAYQIPKSASLASLNKKNVSDGWFHDSANNLLYIKYKPKTTIHSVRINLETAVPLYEKHPHLIAIIIIVAIAAIEVFVFAKRRGNAENES
ncbi:MAG: hypothetical protein JSW72_04790 [Candidatus Bathyarchaeota archaeon]|nr:MAG: hypothetical protein JSW72_04790 [Candidatus Bathyarchaeota archaeon]